MAKENSEEEMDVRKEDLLLSFYDALMDYDAHEDIMAFRDQLIDQAIMNGYDDATRQGAFNAILYDKCGFTENEEAYIKRIDEDTKKKIAEKKSQDARKKAEKVEAKKIFKAEKYPVKTKKEAIETMRNEINKLLSLNGNYKDWHSELCGALVNIYQDLSEVFTYGNAQKWVNMTIKYLHVYANLLEHMKEVGGSNNPLKNLLSESSGSKGESFHIPLDSYILKALFREDLRVEINKEAPNLIDEDTDLIRWIQENVKAYKKLHNGVDSDGAFVAKMVDSYPEFKKGKVEPVTWSKIGTYGAYEKIQEAVKACIPSEYKERPLEWENKVWLAFSKVKPGN